MKRILFVLALMLILTVCFVGEAFALNHPWTEADDNGDDHPWGGDEVGTVPPPPPSTKYDNIASYSTGIIPIDFIFRYFIIDEIYSFENKYQKLKYHSPSRYESLKYGTDKREGIRK